MVATRDAYNEAILNPSRCLNISDMDVRGGYVEKIHVKTKAGAYEIPWGVEGGFAVVYKFRTQSGQFKALRCFRRPMKDDLKSRYEQISTYFQLHIPTVTAGFAYYDSGISVKEKVGMAEQEVLRPLIIMDWIEGVTLLKMVDKLCQQSQRDELRQLSEQWLKLLNVLRQAKVAHGDFSGENVMVKNDGSLVLIDYDGVYIPSFQNLAPIVGGQGEYQHPQMKQRPFNEQMDGFSAYVIYIALLALHHRPDLWQTYAPRSPQGRLLGTHMLFTKDDFLNLAGSSLFADLQRITDPALHKALTALEQACRLPIEHVQLPIEALGDPDKEAKEALALLKQAIDDRDDERVVQCWIPVLHTYAPAQQYKNDIQAAELRLQQLQPFLAAIQSGNIQQIAAAYKALSPYISGNITQQQRAITTLATDFANAYTTQDEEALVKSVEAIERFPQSKTLFSFTIQEEQSVQQARQRVTERDKALQDFRLALHRGNIEEIVKTYDNNAPMLNGHKDIDQRERDRLELARMFLTIYQQGDDQALLAVYGDMSLKRVRSLFRLTPQERQRIEQAQKVEKALSQLRDALTTRSLALIANAYDPLLDSNQYVKQEERTLVQLAQEFVVASMNDDDAALSKAWDAIEHSPLGTSLVLTAQEMQHVKRSQQRMAVLVPLQQALQEKSIEKIANAYDPLLNTSKSITPTERTIIRLAQEFFYAHFVDDDVKLLEAYEKIQSQQSQALDLSPYQAHITDVQQRQQALNVLRRHTLYPGKKNAQEIINAYNPILDNSKSVTKQERDLLEAACNFLHMYKDIIAALDANNGSGDSAAVVRTYDEELAERFTDFTAEQKQLIALIMNHYRLNYALQHNQLSMIIEYANKVQVQTRERLPQSQQEAVSAAKQQFIQQCPPRNVRATAKNGRAYVSWEWPESDLITHALVEWRPDRVPRQPEEGGGISLREFRNTYEQRGKSFEFPIGTYPQIYLRVYMAIPDHTRPGNPTSWLYSNGVGPDQPIDHVRS